MANLHMQKKFVASLMVLQLLFLILFAVFAEYQTKPGVSKKNQVAKGNHEHNDINDDLRSPDCYAMFQDVHVMVVVGFAFLMSSVRKLSYTAVGISMLIVAITVQWSLIIEGLVHLHEGKFQVRLCNSLSAEFGAISVLVSFAALLGNTSPLQLLLIAFVETVIFSLNRHIGIYTFQAVDVGGSMFVHVFGAYFGLAVSRTITTKSADNYRHSSDDNKLHMDLFGMLGTLFLWVYWPSFNSAFAYRDNQERALINTYLSLAASCVTTFAISSVVNGSGKFRMEHIQRATLAGGVAVGTSADMLPCLWNAVLIGIAAAIFSTTGLKFTKPALERQLKLQDTCGVNNLHGIPGIIGGIAGAIAAMVASADIFGYGLYTLFPARTPMNGSELQAIQEVLPGIHAGEARGAALQGAMQISALVLSFSLAIAGGALTGLLLRIPFFNQDQHHSHLDDFSWWNVQEDYQMERHERVHPAKVARSVLIANPCVAVTNPGLEQNQTTCETGSSKRLEAAVIVCGRSILSTDMPSAL